MDVNQLQNALFAFHAETYQCIALLWVYFSEEFVIVPLCAASRDNIEAYIPMGHSG